MGSTSDKVAGYANQAAGSVKQGVGKAVGSEELQVKGAAQDLKGKAQVAVGDIKDVLMSQEGKVTALIVSVGGFLGIGEKDVAVPFSSVTQKMKDGKSYLTLDTTKDALKSAPGFKYDSKSMMWAPAT